MTLRFAPERLADCLEEVRSLGSAHYAEIGGYSETYTESIDFEAYLEMERLGVLLSVFARDDGRLVGYFGGVQHCDLHSAFEGRRILAVTQIVFYMLPRWRSGAAAFCREIEHIAAEKGISWIAFGSSPKNRSGAFFRHLGYKEGETLWIWVNDHEAVARR